MKVCKFGGTSLADARQISKVCDIVLSDPQRRLVVVSAPGKRNKKDTKVTDMLIACAEARLAGQSGKEEMDGVIARYAEICRDLKLPQDVIRHVESDFRERLSADMSHKGQFVDQMKAAGEDNSARVVAAALRGLGSQAKYLNPWEGGLLLSEEYGNAQILQESYRNLSKIKQEKGIIVFPGFFGFTKGGQIVTFPRGGSDITGSILSVSVQAECYENFTDVDSVFCVDPSIVKDAKPIEEITYREMRELSYAGFSVLHEEAITPTVKAGIPICIKNTNRPDAPGTRIVPVRNLKRTDARVVGIASSDGFCAVYVDKYLMNREVGFGRKFLQIFEEEAISYEHAPSGIDNMSVIFREDAFDRKMEEKLLARIRTELNPDNVEVDRGLALIMIVGEGMQYTVGMAARATKAFSDSGVNIEMMNQGSSEMSMMFGIKAVDRVRAVAALYNAFFK